MKVLFICSTLKRTGPTNQLYNITSELMTSGHCVTLLTLSPESNDSLYDKFIKNDIKVHSLNLSRFGFLIHGKEKLNEVIHQLEPDILHTQGIKSDWLSSNKKLRNIKKLSTLRNIPWLDYPMTYGRILGNIMFKFHLNILNKLDGIAVVSKSIESAFECKKLTSISNKMSVVHNGVDTDYYNPDKVSCTKIELFGAESYNKKILVSVGHLSGRKDPETIINAFLDSSIVSDSLLVFIGSGPLHELLLEKYGSNDSLLFVGRKGNVDDYLYHADLFISASRAEGFPNTVLEALSFGLPCCLSDIGPHLEFKNYFDSTNALSFFELGNSKALKGKLENFSACKEDKIFTRKNAIKHLSKKSMVDKYINLYSRL
ncbi:glycosyltransferase [Vibrio cyclitrophicus 1F53]|uniref:glycosyltransferase n=1 Tax=Vibrio cyclitrophicus TaxID=47951 RepID=UPI00389E837B